jgi:hypothetical protein
MAIAVQLDFKQSTLEQYDQVLKLMNLEPGGQVPPGALFHWVTAIDEGFRVTDVWESRDAFEAFAREHILPLAQQVGLQAAPEITFFEVHNHLSAH